MTALQCALTTSKGDIRSTSSSLTGQRLGPYEIGPLIGAGGMGTYTARATPCSVATWRSKILPDVFAADASRRARFEREARVLASLNHPHIGAIYGFERRDDIHGLVLELVEGETLADRVRRGPLPAREALLIARQIGEALEAAHERNIVHRDLKPANIILQYGSDAPIARATDDVKVKVLDFGLAKAALDDSATEFGDSPTITAGGTQEGVILGTATYMSPEQARGRVVDRRTDIWAFGCILWEMLTGRRTFAGETVSDTIAAILEREADWSALPSDTPPSLTRLLHRCLEKDPKRRLHHIADARIEIDDALAAAVSVGHDQPYQPRPRMRRSTMAVVGLGLAGVAAAVAAIAIYSRASSIGAPVRLSVSTPGLISPQLSATLSPDGRELAFVSTGDSGKLMLWIRSLESGEARVLPGTDNAAHPFWSPDGRYVAFLAEGKLRKTAAAGGPVDTIADAPERFGGTWSRDDKILFAGRLGELNLIPAAGGPMTTIVARDPQGRRATWPHFLPDGRHFLYGWRGSKPEERGVYVRALDSPDAKLLVQTEFKGAYASGHLLFVRGETLFAQPFDPDRLALSGVPARVANGIWGAAGAAQASFSASRTGTIAYVNSSLLNLQLAWFDRSGRLQSLFGAPAPYGGTLALSPDGQRVALSRGPSTQRNIWLMNADGTVETRLTFGSGQDVHPTWSPNGQRFAFLRGSRVYVKHASGAGSEELVADGLRIFTIDDWSPDGRFLVYTGAGERSISDLWLLPLDSGKPRLFLQSAFNKAQAQVSPDSRWIAYTSYESGHDEVYVESFPSPGSKRQISVAGGAQPRWRSDGKELFYVAPDQRLMAVPVRLGATFDAGSAAPLFKVRFLPHGSQSIGLTTLYDVTPDGQRFLYFGPPLDREAPITVVLNWLATLPR